MTSNIGNTRTGSGIVRRAADRGAPVGGLSVPSHLLAVSLVVMVGGLGACSPQPVVLEELSDSDTCRRTALLGPPAEALDTLESDEDRQAAVAEWAVDWRLPPESTDVVQLNAWCAAVGPAVVGGWGDTVALPQLDTLWVVTWNVHIGGADLDGLVEDLRAGRLTNGLPVEHFVLLLQEVHRTGAGLPDYDPDLPGGSETTPAPAASARRDILSAAEEYGLWLFYVPSMRNGRVEDRGNAILSTLELRDPVAVGLPMARQRRVAVAATVAARTREGRDWRLQVASVHLESSPAGWTSDERQRLDQAEALIALLPEAEAAVAAGDFNTKTRGQEEALVRVMLRAYPDTPPFPTGPTYQKAFGLYREYLDYIFYRLPEGVEGRYGRISRIYESDHFPLVGRVVW